MLMRQNQAQPEDLAFIEIDWPTRPFDLHAPNYLFIYLRDIPSKVNDLEYSSSITDKKEQPDVSPTISGLLFLKSTIIYAITPRNHDEKQQIRELLTKEGFAAVVKKYQGVWLNREPYGLFVYFGQCPKQYLPVANFNLNYYSNHHIPDADLDGLYLYSYFYRRARGKFDPGKSEELKLATPLPELELIKEVKLKAHKGFSVDELEAIERRLKLIGSLFPEYRSDDRFLFHMRGIEHIIPDEFIFNFPLPKLAPANDKITLKLIPPQDSKPNLFAQFLDSLQPLEAPIEWSIDSHDSITYYLSGTPKDLKKIEQKFSTYHKDVYLEEAEDYPSAPYELFFWPKFGHTEIAQLKDFTLDPLSTLMTVFDQLSADESLTLSLLSYPIVLQNLDPLFDQKVFAPQGIKVLQQITRDRLKKLPAWMVRLKISGTSQERLEQVINTVIKSYETHNQFFQVTPISETGQTPDYTREWGVMSTDEITSMMHLPTKDVQSKRLEVGAMKSVLPPDLFTTGEVIIGESTARGKTVSVSIPYSVRDRHLYLIGKTRMGKSTLITNLALEDIKRGRGVAVIDPHGDLVEDLLNRIPQERIKDTINFDAKETAHPITLNIFKTQSENEAALLADNLLVTFRRLSESWGPRMDEILSQVLLTLASVPNSTFIDIKRILQNEKYRQSVVRQLRHPIRKEFWEKDFPGYPKDAIIPILARVNRFLRTEQFYNMLSNENGRLSIYDVIDRGQILLVNLASGRVGEDNAQLLGSLLVSQIQQAVMRRAGLPREARIPYYLYVDEFQNFTNSSFDKILSEAGKYQLCLTLAHQFISQLEDRQRDAIFGNVGTMIMFGVGDRDANALKYQLGGYEPTDLLNLPRYHALCRPTTAARDTFMFRTLPPPPKGESHAEEIIFNTKLHYGLVQEEEEQLEAPPIAPVNYAQASEQVVLKKADSLSHLSNPDQILYYISKARYLSARQIGDLVFSDSVTEGARKTAVSKTAGKLEEAKELSSLTFEREKIYYKGQKPNVSNHNLTVRDIFVSIINSNFAVSEIKFFNPLAKDQMGEMSPDLSVTFESEKGLLIKTFWEYDTGTEHEKVILSKVNRYLPYLDSARVIFVVASRARARKIQEVLDSEVVLKQLYYVCLDELILLNDPVFYPFIPDIQGSPLFI
jgi:DNA helicase HerA-like ATPase